MKIDPDEWERKPKAEREAILNGTSAPDAGKDRVPALLTPGEVVMPVKTVRAFGGPAVLEKIIEATSGRKPGGKPVARDNSIFKGDQKRGRLLRHAGDGLIDAVPKRGPVPEPGHPLSFERIMGFNRGGVVENEDPARRVAGAPGVQRQGNTYTQAPEPPSDRPSFADAMRLSYDDVTSRSPARQPSGPIGSNVPSTGPTTRPHITSRIQSPEPSSSSFVPVQFGKVDQSLLPSNSSQTPRKMLDEMTGVSGTTMRAVEGTPNVSRIDAPGKSTLYTNDPGTTGDFFKGGGTVNTISSDAMRGGGLTEAQQKAMIGMPIVHGSDGYGGRLSFDSLQRTAAMNADNDRIRQNRLDGRADDWTPTRTTSEDQSRIYQQNKAEENADRTRFFAQGRFENALAGLPSGPRASAARATLQNKRFDAEQGSIIARMREQGETARTGMRDAGDTQRMGMREQGDTFRAQLQEQGHGARTAASNALEQERLGMQQAESREKVREAASINSLREKALAGDEQAMQQIRALRGKDQAAAKPTVIYDEELITPEKPENGTRRVPYVMGQDGSTRRAIPRQSRLPEGVSAEAAMASARHYQKIGVPLKEINQRLAALGMDPLIADLIED